MSDRQDGGKHFYSPQGSSNPYGHEGGASRGGRRRSHRPEGKLSHGSSRGQRYQAVPMRSELDGHQASYAPRRPRKRKGGLAAVIVLIVLVVLVGGGFYLFHNPPFFQVTVNGAPYTVNAGTTLTNLVEKGYASPKAGNLMAVDGSVAQEGGGPKFTATVDGQQVDDENARVSKGQSIEISDGRDATEDYTEQTETLPHGTGGDDMNSFNNYWAGAIHVYSDGEDGEQVVKTGKVSGKTATEVTKQPVDAGYHVYSVDTKGDKVIALTFDDGPWPTTTTEILDVLKENDAHATFFQIGNQIAEHTDAEKRMHDEGHQIGSHTWDHASGSGGGVDLTKMSTQEQLDEVNKGFNAIDSVLGTQTERILRAPGGNYHGSIITTLKDTVKAEIGWDVDTEDWRRPGADAIAKAILSAKPGNVILMHDGGGDRSQTVEALKTALPQLKQQGYRFVTIDELLAYGMPGSQDSSSQGSSTQG